MRVTRVGLLRNSSSFMYVLTHSSLPLSVASILGEASSDLYDVLFKFLRDIHLLGKL